MNTEAVVLRVRSEFAQEFNRMWDDIRISQGAGPEYSLNDAEEIEKFDAAAAVQWAIDLTTVTSPIVTGILGYLVAKRGEVEVGGMKFKNMSVRDMKEIIKYMDEREGKK